MTQDFSREADPISDYSDPPPKKKKKKKHLGTPRKHSKGWQGSRPEDGPRSGRRASCRVAGVSGLARVLGFQQRVL